MAYTISSGESSDGIILTNDSMTVLDEGVVNSVSVSSGGYLLVSSGGVANGTTVNPWGSLRVTIGGVANSTTINSAGYFNVSSGGTANSTIVNSSGTLRVTSKGTAASTTVNSGGYLYVSSGGTTTEIIENGGYVYVADGADAVFASNTISGLVLFNYASATVHSGTTAASTTVNSRGYLYVSSGGTANNTTVNSGGDLYVSSGGMANNTTVNSYGYLYVSSGGTANNTTVNSGGRLYVSSGGMANSNTVNSGGDLYVSSGGTANSNPVNSGGRLYVSSGGMATEIMETGGYISIAEGADVSFVPNVFSGLVLSYASATVHSGTTANYATVNWKGKLYVYSGGTAVDVVENGGYVFVDTGATVNFAKHTFSGLTISKTPATVHSGTTANSIQIGGNGGDLLGHQGYMYIYSGGIANSTTVLLGGNLYVYSGGSANNTKVNSSGYLRISSGGTANNITVNSGGKIYIYGGGIANAITVSSGGCLHVSSGGTATNIIWTPCEGLIFIGDGAKVTFASAYSGVYYVSDNQLLSHTTKIESKVISGSNANMHVMSGGTANSATVNSGGNLYVYSGGSAKIIRENGGCVHIAEGADVSFVPNVFSGLVLSYARATVHSGTTANYATVNWKGNLYVYSGGSANYATVNSYGYLYVYSGGSANYATVNSYGYLYVYSGGTANSATVNPYGSMFLSYGGAASDTTVKSDGCLFVSRGGRITGQMTFENGAVVSAYEGAVLNFDLNRTEVGASALMNDLSVVHGAPQYTLTVPGTHANGSYIYNLAEGATNFTGTLTVQNAIGNSIGTITIGKKAIIEGVDYSLSISDDAMLKLMIDRTFCIYGNSLIDNHFNLENNRTITLLFSEELDASSFSMDMISLTGKKDVSIAIADYAISGNMLTLNYEPLTEEGTYKLRISERIKSVEEFALDQNRNRIYGEADDAYELQITADFTGPKVVKVSPEENFAGTLTKIQIMFSEAIDFESLRNQISLICPNGKTVTPVSYQKVTASCIEVMVPEQTAYGQYQIKVGNQICDLAGNRLDQNGDGIPGGVDDNYVSMFNITEIDLKVSDLALNKTTFRPGETVKVRWTDYNNGGYALSGSWTDGVYLSTDTRWDVNDILLGNLTHEGGLKQNEQLSNSIDVQLAGVPTGTYYLLVRSDIYMQEKGDRESALAAQNLEAVEITVELPELAIDGTVSGHVSKSGDYAVYHLTQDANESLRLVLDSKTDSANMEIYVGYGYVPTREKYDSKAQNLKDGSMLLNAPDAANSVYVMVYGKNAKTAFDYVLSVESVPMSIADVTGTTQGNSQGSIFELTGVAFAPGMTVCLTDQSGNKYTAENVTFINTSRVNAEFFAGSLSSGRYTLSVEHDDRQADYSKNITISDNAGAEFNIRFIAPSNVGWKSISELYVKYSNSGYDVMDAPLVIVHPHLTDGREGAFLTLDPSILTDGFWTSTKPAGFEYSVQMLASGSQPGYLEADPSGKSEFTIPVYYASWQTPWPEIEISIDWGVSYIESSNTSKLDWEKYLLDAGKTKAQTALLVKNLTQSIGTTWGDYVKMLNRNMRYLYESNIPTENVSVTDLFNLEYMWASGAIAGQKEMSSNTDFAFGTDLVSLDLTRKYFSGFDSRLSTSSFGVGWTCSWDMHLEIASNGDLTFVNGEDKRLYQPNYSKGYQTVAKDGSVIKEINTGGFRLTESDGTVRVFNASGQLTSLVDANGKEIVFSYENNMLIGLTAGSEIWTITRNAAGLITSVTDQDGHTSKYVYDADNHLISVTNPDSSMTTYAYGDDSLKSLISVNGDNGAVFTYDANGRLNSIVRNSHTCSYDYGTTGKVTVSLDGTVVGTTYYGLNGAPGKTVAADDLTIGNILSGCIMNEEGIALTGITVNAVVDGKIISSITDADGLYVFTGLPETTLNLFVQDATYLSLNEYLNVDGILVADRKLVQANNSVYGTYTYSDITEVATILLTNKTTGDVSIVTGRAGTFAAYNLAVGEYDLEIFAGDSASYYDSFTIEEDSQYQTVGNFDLKVGGNLSVTAKFDSALNNALVSLVDENGRTAAFGLLAGSGVCTFNNLAEGTYTATVSAGNFMEEKTVKIEPLGETEISFVLDNGVAVSGFIKDGSGNAHKGMYLELSNGEDTWMTSTDYAGKYEFRNLPAGSYALSVYGNYAPLKTFTIVDGQQDITLNCNTDYLTSWSGMLIDAEGIGVTGTVSLYQDGQFLDSIYTSDGFFRFDVNQEGDYSVVVESETGFFSQLDAAHLTADNAMTGTFTLGSYNLTVNTTGFLEGETVYILSQMDGNGVVIAFQESDEPEFAGLTEGKYRLTAYNGNYKAEKEFDVAGNTSQTLEFEQLNELRIQLQEIKEELYLLLYDSNGDLVDLQTVQEAGIYTFSALEAGDYRIVAFGDNSNAVQDISVKAGSELIQLQAVDSTRNISGTVTVDGRACEYASVIVRDQNNAVIGLVLTDEVGNYKLKVADALKYNVLIMADGTPSQEFVCTPDSQDGIVLSTDLSQVSTGSDLMAMPEEQMQFKLWTPAGWHTDHVLDDRRKEFQQYDNRPLWVNASIPQGPMCSVCKKKWDTYQYYKMVYNSKWAAANYGFELVEKNVYDLWYSIGSFIAALAVIPLSAVGLTGAAAVMTTVGAIAGVGNLIMTEFKNVLGIVQSILDLPALGFISFTKEAPIFLSSLTHSLKTCESAIRTMEQGKTISASHYVLETNRRGRLSARLGLIQNVGRLLDSIALILAAWDFGQKIADFNKALSQLDNDLEELKGASEVGYKLWETLPNCPCKCDREDDQPPPETDGSEVEKAPTPIAYSVDPNDKTVMEGFGKAGYITGSETLNYKIEFENDSKWATAPARWVRVYDTLAEEFDLDTFELKSICIAGNYIEVGDGRDSCNELHELTIKDDKVLTQISVNLDSETRQLVAEFTAIDPETGWMLQDVQRGILLPNDEIGSGEGFFTYSVALREDIAHGTEITNTAKIYFDFNDPIDTPTTLNTVDRENPSAAFIASVDGTEITLALNGTDADSGIAGYNILYSSDGENFSDYGYTTDAEVSITGSSDTVYYFKIQAVDNVGNVSDWSDAVAVNMHEPDNAPDDGENQWLYNKKTKKWNEENIPSFFENIIKDGDSMVYLDQKWTVESEDGKFNFLGRIGTKEDAADYAKIKLANGAALNFSVDSTIAGTFYVYQVTKDKKGNLVPTQRQKIAVKANKTSPAKMTTIYLDAGEYFVGMETKLPAAKKGDVAGYYNVNLTGTKYFENADDGWNNRAYVLDEDAGKEDKTKLNATLEVRALLFERGVTTIKLDDGAAGTDDWVGFSDITDYRMLKLENAVNLTLSLSVMGTETGKGKAKLTVWQVSTGNGSKITLSNKGSVTVKQDATGLIKSKVLDAGTYFISVTSTDAKKGGDVSYSVKVDEKTVFFDSADGGINNVLYDKKAKAFKSDANFLSNEVGAGSQSILLDDGVEADGFENFVGYGDAIDYAKINLTSTGNLSFALVFTGDATFTVYKKGEKKSKEILETIQTTKLSLAKDGGVRTTDLLFGLEAGEYYISMAAKSTKANASGSVFYNVTATLDPSVSSALTMPETDSHGISDALSFGGYDVDALVSATASSLTELTDKVDWQSLLA